MRILYVVHQFYPQYISGTEQYVLALAQHGRQAGDDVRVFTLDPDFAGLEPPTETRSFEFEGVPVVRYRFDKRRIRNHALQDFDSPEVGPPFRRVLDEFTPDVVHFFHLRWHGLDRIDDVAARGVPFVVHLMDFWYLCPNFLLLRPGAVNCDGPPDGGLGCFDCVHGAHAEAGRSDAARARYASKVAGRLPPEHAASPEATGYALMQRPAAMRIALERADLVISPSRTVRDVFAAAAVTPPRLEVVPYAVDRARLERLADPAIAPIAIGFLGTIAPHKGVDVLVRALRAIDDPGVVLRVHGRTGDYPQFDRELHDLAAGDERIRFEGPFRREDLPAVLSALHVAVVPSRWRENTPFVCLEARAAGVDLVASDLPGMSEALPDGRGCMFRVGDAAHLAEVLTARIAAARQRGGRRLPPDTTIPTLAEQWRDFRSRYSRIARARRPSWWSRAWRALRPRA